MAQVLSPASGPGVAYVKAMTNLDEVNARVQTLLTKFKGSIPEVLNAHALDFEAACKQKAPIDTGRFHNSIHTVSAYKSSDSYTYRDNLGNSFDGTLNNIPVTHGDVFVATVGTNVDYAIFLEAGHSRQAPQGVFGITLLEKKGALEAAIQSQLTLGDM